MDKAIYIAMLGAKQTLAAQAVNSHNLANASTTGFKADLASFSPVEVQGAGFASRANVMAEDGGWSRAAGQMQNTGRELDLAVQGRGFIAIQDGAGREAYTRDGNLNVTADGLLETRSGHLVLGENGPISLPPSAKLNIGSDGTISLVPEGQGPETMVRVDRVKLVAAPDEAMAKGRDGLFRAADGEALPAEAGVTVQSGVLESSNVNPAEALVQMIELSRQFEMQVRTMSTAERNAETATRMLRA